MRHAGRKLARVLASMMATSVLALGLLSLVACSGTSYRLLTPTFSEFLLPTAQSGPGDITPGPDGALWFTERVGDKIGRITSTGGIQEYPTPTDFKAPLHITAGSDGNLWFTAQSSDVKRIGSITPTGQFLSGYIIPANNDISPASDLIGDITSGPSSTIWFTDIGGNQIGRIAQKGGLNEFPIPTANSEPSRIVEGPDGALWFTESKGNQIGRITLNGSITEYRIPTANCTPVGIAALPDGAIWFTERGANQIGRLTPSTGAIKEFPVKTANSHLNSITAGPNGGSLYFTEFDGNNIGGATPTGESLQEYPIPTTASRPLGITAGPNSTIWFAEYYGNKIGRITLT